MKHTNTKEETPIEAEKEKSESKFKSKIRDNALADLIKTPFNQRTERVKEKLKDDEEFIERRILTGIITSDEFCGWAKDFLKLPNLESPHIALMCGWVFEYYDQYGKAPGRNIESIYIEKLKAGMQKEKAEWIEGILEGLSKECENKEEFNIQYLKNLTERHQAARIMRRKIEDATDLLDNNQIEDAAEEFQYENPLSENDLLSHIYTVAELEQMEIVRPKLLMSPWLREGETNFFYADYGVGKSLLTILFSYVLGCENYKESECDIGPWQVKNPTGTLYIDGELSESEMLNRIGKFKWLGKQLPEFEMRIISLPDYYRRTDQDFDLTKRKTQKEIAQFFKKHPNYKHLVVDTISMTMNLEDENSNSEWNRKIKPLIQNLRGLGVAHTFLHHAGKNGEMRGASAMGGPAANIFFLEDRKKEKEKGQAWFSVDNKDKQRASGKGFDKFTIKFLDLEDRTEFEITDNDSGPRATENDGKMRQMAEIIKGIDKDVAGKDLAVQLHLSEGRIAQLKKEMVEKGFLYEESKKPTSTGHDLARKYMDKDKI